MGREVIYKDFNSSLIIYKETAALGSNIYKGRFIAYRRAFINIFNKRLIIIIGGNIISNRVFSSIYNKKLIIIIGKYL